MREKRTKFISHDDLRICIYIGKALVAEFPNNVLGKEEYNNYLLGLSELNQQCGVFDADAGENITFDSWSCGT